MWVSVTDVTTQLCLELGDSRWYTKESLHTRKGGRVGGKSLTPHGEKGEGTFKSHPKLQISPKTPNLTIFGKIRLEMKRANQKLLFFVFFFLFVTKMFNSNELIF